MFTAKIKAKPAPEARPGERMGIVDSSPKYSMWCQYHVLVDEIEHKFKVLGLADILFHDVTLECTLAAVR